MLHRRLYLEKNIKKQQYLRRPRIIDFEQQRFVHLYDNNRKLREQLRSSIVIIKKIFSGYNII